MDEHTDLTSNNSNDDSAPKVYPTSDETIKPTDSVNDDTPNINKPTSVNDINPDQVANLKAEIIEYAKKYAKTGTSTRKEPSSNLVNDQGPFYWWEKQATFESDTWSVSFWEYDNKTWQLQATKVELKPDGHSQMTAYSMRKDTDPNFPGFQVYKEEKDDRYHQATVEEIVYLNRIIKGLLDADKT
jgi:hypothetical protein